MKFPEIRGTCLNKIPFTFPNDLKGKLNILILPFRKTSKLLLERWLSFIEILISDISFLDYYQIRVFNRSLRIIRRYLDERVRRNTLEKDFSRIIHFYQESHLLTNILNLKDPNSIYIFLLDQNGKILWKTEGKYDLDKAQLLKQKIIENMNEL